MIIFGAMATLLQQPFPTFTPGKRGVLVCFLAGCCVFLILFVFKAFGMHNLPTGRRFYFALCFAAATFIVSLLHAVILPLVVPFVFREEKWTVAKEIVFFLWVIICVAIANVFVDHWLDGSRVDIKHFFSAIGMTTAVGIFPVIISIVVKQQSLLRRFSTEAKQIEDKIFPGTPSMPIDRPVLPIEKAASVNSTFVELTGENMQDKLQLPIDSLLYMHAADNYVRIFYSSNSEVRNSILRSPLRKMEETLAAFPQFYRCHRTYLVNLHKVVHISGNAQGFKLHLAETPDLIPVSRSLNKVIAGKLEETKNSE